MKWILKIEDITYLEGSSSNDAGAIIQINENDFSLFEIPYMER